MTLEEALASYRDRNLERVPHESSEPWTEALELAASWLMGNGEGVKAGVLAQFEALSPLLEDATREELTDLLRAGWLHGEPTSPVTLSVVAYEARRAAFQARTQEAAKRARAKAERAAFLADLLVTIGTAGVRLIPLLIATL